MRINENIFSSSFVQDCSSRNLKNPQSYERGRNTHCDWPTISGSAKAWYGRLSLPDSFGSAQLSAILGAAHILRKLLCLITAGMLLLVENPKKENWRGSHHTITTTTTTTATGTGTGTGTATTTTTTTITTTTTTNNNNNNNNNNNK